MQIHKYTNIKEIIENIYRNAGYQNIDWFTIAEHIGRFIGLFGSGYTDKITDGQHGHIEPLIISEYRCLLPKDLVEITGVRDWFTKKQYIHATNINHLNNNLPLQMQPTLGNDVIAPIQGLDYNEMLMAEQTISKFMTDYTDSPTSYRTAQLELKYTVNNNFIYTSVQSATIEVAYKAYPVDDDGMPLIPDNEIYKRALEAYIIERLDYILYRQDRLKKEIYEDSRNKYLFAVASAKSSLSIPSIDEMESLKNSFIRLIEDPMAHANGWKYNNERERIWRQ